MNIVIGGDYFPTKENEKLFIEGDIERLFGHGILKLFSKSDFSIVNIEGAFFDVGSPIKKSGPHIGSCHKAFQGYMKLGFSLGCLANNHSMDYGENGLYLTMELLNSCGLGHVGAGNNCVDAAKPYIFEKKGERIGIVACSEHQWKIATKENSGANPYEARTICSTIKSLRNRVDYIIVLYHGGIEHYRYPAPYLMNRCRQMVENGADIVVCQHSHCIGCAEHWGGSEILYGQGDFLFHRKSDEYRDSGLLIEIDTEKKEITYHPVVRYGHGTRMAESEKKEELLSSFYQRGKDIKEAGFVEEKYRLLAEKKLCDYEAMRFGILGLILRRLGFSSLMKLLRVKSSDMDMLNALRCEAHRDLYIHGLETMEN